MLKTYLVILALKIQKWHSQTNDLHYYIILILLYLIGSVCKCNSLPYPGNTGICIILGLCMSTKSCIKKPLYVKLNRNVICIFLFICKVIIAVGGEILIFWGKKDNFSSHDGGSRRGGGGGR